MPLTPHKEANSSGDSNSFEMKKNLARDEELQREKYCSTGQNTLADQDEQSLDTSYAVSPKKLETSASVSSSDQKLMAEEEQLLAGKTDSSDCCDQNSEVGKPNSSGHQTGDPIQPSCQDISPSDYPAEFKEGHFDCVIIYSDNELDRKIAINFKDIIEEHLILEDKRPPAVCILDRGDNLPCVQSRFKHSDIAMQRSTFMFLLMTENFISDSWAEMQKDECLMLSISEEDRKWCVVPLYTKPKEDLNCPFGLRALKGLDISDMLRDKKLEDVDPKTVRRSDLDKYFVEKLTKMFNQHLKRKVDREKEQEKKLKEWIQKEMERREKIFNEMQQWKKEQLRKHQEKLGNCQIRPSNDHVSQGN